MFFDPFTSDAEVIAIGTGLNDRTLAKSNWSHAAHFAATLWLLKNHPEMDPCRVIPKLIRAYNEATGVANTDDGGYHETITQVSIRRHALFSVPARTPLFSRFVMSWCDPLSASQNGFSHSGLDRDYFEGGALHMDRARPRAAAILNYSEALTIRR